MSQHEAFEAVLSKRYPETDWTGFTADQYWETEGLTAPFFESEYAKSLDVPRYASLYGSSASGTPGEFYDWYQGLDAGDQEIFGTNPFDVLQRRAEIDTTEIDTTEMENALARQEEARGVLNPFFTGRMDDEWSMFGPEARGALERRIGNQLAVAQRGISGNLRRRGIYGSGIEAQLEMDAQNIAAGSTAEMYGQISMADELARERAAGQYKDMYQTDVQGLTGWSYNAADFSVDQGRYLGEMEGAGPLLEYLDTVDVFENVDERNRFEEELQKVMAEGNLAWWDLPGILTAMAKYEFNLPDAVRDLFGG